MLYAVDKGGGMMIDNQIMVFPKTFKEFADMFSIKDTDEVYSNGIDFIPVFRVEQWLEHTMAIKALEQEPVLDKIRAEIEQEQDDFMDDKDYEEGIRFGLMLAYQIIDKYKAESEE